MNITGSRDGKVFFIDDDKVMIDGKMYYEKAPQNLPKADEYSLLGEVPNITDENIQELREIILDSGSSRNYQNKQIREWFVRHFA